MNVLTWGIVLLSRLSQESSSKILEFQILVCPTCPLSKANIKTVSVATCSNQKIPKITWIKYQVTKIEFTFPFFLLHMIPNALVLENLRPQEVAQGCAASIAAWETLLKGGTQQIAAVFWLKQIAK